MPQKIQMVDLRSQYERLKGEIDQAIADVLTRTDFIRGGQVGAFECNLAGYLGGQYALGVGNGTDALQVALMAAGVGPGDEVITTPFTFIATAEAAALLGAKPVFADIDAATFNIDPDDIEGRITERTKAIVPVHLFGQCAEMDPITDIANRHNLIVIEDNAQSIGASYRGRMAGFIGHIGCLSFFPSKNLGAFGDGGAVLTNDAEHHRRMRRIANHGAEKKYYHEVVGVNSRLDTIQAAVLNAKLPHLDDFAERRRRAADRYDALLGELPWMTVPFRSRDSTHVFHQYTVRVDNQLSPGRDALAALLKERGIPHAIYYPVPLHQLPVFGGEMSTSDPTLSRAEQASREVLSLPMHTELTEDQQEFIAETIRGLVT
jgi:UDP-2-acetamido-2-deoxy-ribo-hexuluronate aminotransferase